MNCDQISVQLFDYEEDILSADELRLIRAHLGGCHSCNRELKSVRLLMKQARDLNSESTPARDLWPEILNRLEDLPEKDEVPSSVSGPWVPAAGVASRTRKFRARYSQWVGIAAALGFLALFAPMTIKWIGSMAGSERKSLTTAHAQRTGPSDPRDRAAEFSNIAAQARVETGVLQTKRDLSRAIERQRSILGPEAFSQVATSIREVDLAIGETRAALGKFPESRQLNHRLAALYLSESDLLKRLSRV